MTCLFCGWFVKYDPRDMWVSVHKAAALMAEHFVSARHGAVVAVPIEPRAQTYR